MICFTVLSLPDIVESNVCDAYKRTCQYTLEELAALFPKVNGINEVEELKNLVRSLHLFINGSNVPIYDPSRPRKSLLISIVKISNCSRCNAIQFLLEESG